MANCSNGSLDHLILTRYPHYLLLPLMLYMIGQIKLSVATFLFTFYFFRSPDRKRTTAAVDTDILSPADGKVLHIYETQDHHVVVIYLSPLDVHVQYMPIDGEIFAQRYKKGEFNMAYILEKSNLNERLETDILTQTGNVISVHQIAGQVAQRIESYVKKGDRFNHGCKLGIIKFGSRVDVYVPKNRYVPVVSKGQVASAITTILFKST